MRHRSNRIYDADLARSYLAPADAKLAGYVSLTTGSIRRESAPRRSVRGMTRHPIPTILMKISDIRRMLGTTLNVRRSAERDYRARSPMMSREQIRRLALALPEVVEQDHHGRPSFRVAGRIFATLWDEGHMNVMLDEPGIRTALQSTPIACAEFWWGKRLRAVQVDLALAEEALVAELLTDAWEQKAPRRLTS